jgi:nicotinate-nucleotide adenylyltransferase
VSLEAPVARARPGPPRRIGIFGGTFDPVHIGHLVAAVNARAQLGLERVLVVVANLPWQKLGSVPISPAAVRLEMVAAALTGLDGLEASGLEIERGGRSYSIDTVAEVTRRYPGSEPVLVLGEDAAAAIETWERAEELRELVVLGVVTRPDRGGATPVQPDLARGWRVERIEIPSIAVSATDLRERARTGLPLDVLVPQAALRVIEHRALYHA